jgi:hypothetical protein
MDVESGAIDANTNEVDPVGANVPGEIGDAATFGLTYGIDRIRPVTGCPHFNHNLAVLVDRNEIELATGDLEVGAQDVETVIGKEPGSQPLAKAPKFPTA